MLSMEKAVRTPLLKRRDVAQILGVSERTVRRIIDLPLVRVRGSARYRPEDVDKYIARKTVR
jgi:predicted DNA-binding transcriptional regulator AlpA